MRKRLLYWLAAFYLFVVQIVIVANLWQDTRLYILAGINFLVLVFFSILFALASKKQKHKTNNNSAQNSNHNVNENASHKARSGGLKKAVYHFFQHYLFVIVLLLLPLAAAEHVIFNLSPLSIWWIVIAFVLLFAVVLKAIVQKKIFFVNKQFGTRSILFVLSIFVLFLLYSLATNLGIELRLAIVLAVLFALFIFILSIKLFKARRMQKMGSFWSVRLYIYALIISFIIYVLGGYLDIARQEKYVDEQPRLYVTWEAIIDKTQDIFSSDGDITKLTIVSGLDVDVVDLPLNDADLSTGAGQIISTSFVETGDDIGNETSATELTLDDSPTVILEPLGASLRNAEVYATDDPLNYIDVIVYLLEETQTELAEDNYNLSFTYMSKTNENYIYFKTAYYKKLIGTALKPSAKVRCDNYLVMKGILEERDVSDQTGDIFAQYFAEAEELGVLNSCELGAYLVKGNL